MIGSARFTRAALISLLLLSGILGLAGLTAPMLGWTDLARHAAPVLAPAAALSALILVLAPGLKTPPLAKIVAIAGLSCLLLALGGEVLAGHAAKRDWVEASPADTVVVSFNLGDLNPDPERAIKAILGSDADIVTLQEGLPLLRADLPMLAAAYPYRATCGQWWGCEIVILSKRPIVSSGWMKASVKAPRRPWLVWVKTAARDGNPVTVVSTHLAQILPPRVRAEQENAVLALLRSMDRRNIIMTGDFNATGASHSLRRFDRAMAPLTRRTLDFATWPDRLSVLPALRTVPLLALDHLYAAPAWSTVSVRRLPSTTSDHRAVRVGLARAKKAETP